MESPRLSPTLKWLFKITVSAVALYVVFRKIEISQIQKLVYDLRLSLVFLAFVFFNFSQLTSAFRYRKYLKIVDIQLNALRNIKLYYLGMFYNLFLPGGIGGDGYKVWILKKEYNTPWKPLILISFLERLNGLAALVTLALVIMAFIPAREAISIPAPLYVLLATLIFPILYLIISLIDKKYTTSFKVITLQSLSIQLLQLISAYFILASLGPDSGFAPYLFLFLLSSVAAVLPITLGGVGARELVFIYGNALLPIDTGLAVTFSLLFFLITALSSFIGVLFNARIRNPGTALQCWL